MTKIELLESMHILGDIRKRLGADNENDTSKDNKIIKMTPSQLIATWCGYCLGDEDWGYDIIAMYKILERNEKLK
jgi:hypothetical protein